MWRRLGGRKTGLVVAGNTIRSDQAFKLQAVQGEPALHAAQHDDHGPPRVARHRQAQPIGQHIDPPTALTDDLADRGQGIGRGLAALDLDRDHGCCGRRTQRMLSRQRRQSRRQRRQGLGCSQQRSRQRYPAKLFAAHPRLGHQTSDHPLDASTRRCRRLGQAFMQAAGLGQRCRTLICRCAVGVCGHGMLRCGGQRIDRHVGWQLRRRQRAR